VHAGGWLAQKKMALSVGWEYMRPLRKMARIYSWAFGWPLVTKGAGLVMTGLRKAMYGGEVAAYTALEGTKGALQITVEPVARLAYSRLLAIKRFLWDVPIKTVSAAIRTPIALATSPRETILGVRDAIKSVPRNAKEILNSVRQFRLFDTLSNTRKAITDVILPPITRPMKPILAPAYDLSKTIFHANWQTVETTRDNITKVVPDGARRIWNAPGTAKGIVDANQEKRLAKLAIKQQEKQEKKDIWADKVATEMNMDGGARAGGMKNAA